MSLVPNACKWFCFRCFFSSSSLPSHPHWLVPSPTPLQGISSIAFFLKYHEIKLKYIVTEIIDFLTSRSVLTHSNTKLWVLSWESGRGWGQGWEVREVLGRGGGVSGVLINSWILRYDAVCPLLPLQQDRFRRKIS